MKLKIRAKTGFFHHITLLACLCALALGVSLLSYYSRGNEFKINKDQIEIRVINSKWNSFIFTNEYEVRYENQLWTLLSGQKLRIGEVVTMKGEFELNYYGVNSSKFRQYKISRGFLGEMKSKKISSYHSYCDLECFVSGIRTETKKYIQTKIMNTVCYTSKDLTEYLYTIGRCEDVSSFLISLLIDNDSVFSDELKVNLKSMNLSHIISVSGFQVTTLALFLELLINKLQIAKRKRLLTLFPILLVYGSLAGFEPPILRAMISSILSFSVLTYLGRKLTVFHSLLYSSIILLVVFPHFLTSFSFILSVVATLSLVFVPNISTKNPYTDAISQSLITTLYASLFTLPIISQFGNSINPFGILLGSLLLPLIPIISGLLVIGLVPLVGEVFIIISAVLISVSLSIMNAIDNYFFRIKLDALSTTLTSLYYIVLLLLMYAIHSGLVLRVIRHISVWKRPNHELE